VVIASAEKSARGTVRVGSRTSPLGTSAISRPTKAKINTMAVWPTAEAAGSAGQRTYAGLTNQMPTPTRVKSGSSFAIVITSTSPTPGFTPRTFTAARPANRAAITIARTFGAAAPGQSAPTEPANALATEATAKVAMRKYKTPARNPNNGPNATPTYAYRPPVSETRLPAAATQQTISAISTAQTI